MSKRILNALLGISALVIGLGIYVFFKPNAIVSRLFDFAFVSEIRFLLSPCDIPFIKYYFADFLWGFAFCCGLFLIFEPKGKLLLLCGAGGIIFGAVWELLQWMEIAGGTGDIWDIIMYLLAATAAILINLKEKTK